MMSAGRSCRDRRVSETTCTAFSRPASSLPDTPSPDRNGFHLYRLAALTCRKGILLQLRSFFSSVLCRRACSPGVWCAQALIFGAQYVPHLNPTKAAESLTTEGFERSRTGDCLSPPWQT